MENYFWLSVDNVGEEFMALVNGKGEKVEIIVVSCKSKTINRQLSFTINNSKTFVEKIGFLFKDFFKAVILNLYDLDPRGYYPNNLEFCEAVREKFKAVKVPHFFLSAPLVILSTSLITAKIYAKNGEKILILQFSPTSDVIISELTLTKKGYQISDYREISADDLTANENDGIMNFNSNPKGIILCDAPSSMKQLLKNSILKNKKFFEFTKKDGQHVPEFLNEWTKWLMNKSFNKYFVIPYCMRNYDVSFSSNGTLHSLLNVKVKDFVPILKSVKLSKIFTKVYLNFGTNDYKEVLLQENCHQNKITLMVDDESFPTCKIEPIFLPSIQRLPQKLGGIVKNKVPVVGFFHHTSVICTAENDKSNYEFLEAWNGQFGNEVVISFDKEMPTYGRDALESLTAKPSYCVFDLIKIMSMPPLVESIERDSLWQFKIVNDAENPVLLEFDTFEGDRKQASPTFLLAMFLRQQIKVIRAKINSKPIALGFCLLLAKYDGDEKKRIQDQLEEACRLLKIECVFVKFF